jgi:alanine racemase
MGLASRANAVCPGSLLHGFSPVATDLADLSAYRPVLKAIRSRLIHVGPPQRSGRVGVIPLGVVDGYRPISPEASAYVLIEGRRAPIRGVSLEHMVLDLTDIGAARIGEDVIVLGPCGDDQITLYDIAQWHGTHPAHVLMAFDRRIPCSYFGDPAR